MDDYMDAKSDPTAARPIPQTPAPEIIQREKMKTASDITTEHNITHGEWNDQSTLGNALKETMRQGKNWNSLTPSAKESLDMIQTKVSRILTGDCNAADHWLDIEGYAFLERKEIEQG